MTALTVLVVANDAPYLEALRKVGEPTTFVVSNKVGVLQEAAPRADAALVVGGAALRSKPFSQPRPGCAGCTLLAGAWRRFFSLG
jgi:hypothetical protein